MNVPLIASRPTVGIIASYPPPCWDTPPLVLNLANADSGLGAPNETAFHLPTVSLKTSLAARHSTPTPPIQKLAYQHFAGQCVQNNFSKLILRRLSVITDADTSHVKQICLKNTFAALNATDAAASMGWLKTISNGWCTSWRMHETIKLPCVFGCFNENDDVNHYLDCPFLVSTIHEFTQMPLGRNRIYRLALAEPTPQSVIQCAIMYHIYHTAKVGNRETILNGISTRKFSGTVQIARTVAADQASKYSRFFAPTCTEHNTFLHPSRAAPKRNTSDRTAASAPRVSSSRAGPSTFVRAAQANAHNPFLQSTNSSASGRDCRAGG